MLRYRPAMFGLEARDTEVLEILDGNVAAFEARRPAGAPTTLADAQQMIVDTIERMEILTRGHLATADAVLNTAAARAGGARPARILEVATGNGWLLTNMAARAERRGIAVELTGSDLNPDLVSATRLRLERAGLPIEMIRADATDLSDLGEATFDVAVMSLALHHLPASIVSAALVELDRVSGGGMMIIDTRRSLLSLVGMAPLAFVMAPNGGGRFALHDTVATVRRSYTEAELRTLLDDVGLGDRYQVGQLPVRNPQRMVISAIRPR